MLFHNNALEVLIVKQCFYANLEQFSYYFSHPYTVKFEHWFACGAKYNLYTGGCSNLEALSN